MFIQGLATFGFGVLEVRAETLDLSSGTSSSISSTSYYLLLSVHKIIVVMLDMLDMLELVGHMAKAVDDSLQSLHFC